MEIDSAASDSDPEQPRYAMAEDEDWTRFRARVDRDWRRRRARNADPEDDGDLTGPPPGYGATEYRVTDFGDRLLSGPGSELFGNSDNNNELAGSDFGSLPALAPGPGPARYSGHPSHPSMPPVPPVPPPQPAETSGLVRPYFRTGGRTRPSYDLAIEALVSTSERGRVLDHVRVPEHRSICGLCLDTRSVAEVAAYLRLPLGVVRVLIGDVAGLGLVLVHTATLAVGDRPSIEFMERVLSGLRRI